MLSFHVVPVNPGRDDAFGLLERLKMVQPDTLLLQDSEESLHHPVVLRRGAGNELLGDLELLSGADKATSQEDGAVVVPEPQRGEAVVPPDHPLLQSLDGLNRPALTGEPGADALAASGIQDAYETGPAVPAAPDLGGIGRPEPVGLIHGRTLFPRWLGSQSRAVPHAALPPLTLHDPMHRFPIDNDTLLEPQPGPDAAIAEGLLPELAFHSLL